MIQHTVAFRLSYASGSEEERDFLRSLDALSTIPSATDFECLRQVGKKNKFTFGLSMKFASEEDYASYCTHPIHEEFLQTRWIPEVEDFIEIDYLPYREGC